MDFVRIDRSTPLRLWKSESMLDYFRDMRDMGRDEFKFRHGFVPRFAEVVVFPETRVVCEDGGVEAIIDLLESLDEDYTMWGNAVSVTADEFERELSVRINDGVPAAYVYTHVHVSETMDVLGDVDLTRLAMRGFNESNRRDVESVMDWKPGGDVSGGSVVLGYLLAAREVVSNAFSHGRFDMVCSEDDVRWDDIEVCAHVVLWEWFGESWPERQLVGELMVKGLWSDACCVDRMYDWRLGIRMWDSDSPGVVNYACDVLFSPDHSEQYTVHRDFLSGQAATPDWWDE